MTHFTPAMIDAVRAALSIDDFAIFENILVSRGSTKGSLKAQITNPFGRKGDQAQRVYHVWRMVCFQLEGSRPHACVPCGLFWYGTEDREAGRAELKRLDGIADAICAAIGPIYWQGVNRWRRALGQ